MAQAASTASPAVSNAALIDLGGQTLVVDTFMTRLAAEELAAESVRLTGHRPFLVVNSHFHSDHIGGNRAFEDAVIVGTRRMRELIERDAPASREAFEDMAADIRSFAAGIDSDAESSSDRERAAGFRALADAMLSDEQGHEIHLPGALIGDRLDVVGERRASILSYGRGHTDSDLFVHLPDDGVIVAGDLVWTGLHPKTTDGYPADWARVLDRISELGASSVISGHGPPGTAGDISTMADYMRRVDRIISDLRESGGDPADAPFPEGSESWGDVSRYRAGLRDQLAR